METLHVVLTIFFILAHVELVVCNVKADAIDQAHAPFERRKLGFPKPLVPNEQGLCNIDDSLKLGRKTQSFVLQRDGLVHVDETMTALVAQGEVKQLIRQLARLGGQIGSHSPGFHVQRLRRQKVQVFACACKNKLRIPLQMLKNEAQGVVGTPGQREHTATHASIVAPRHERYE